MTLTINKIPVITVINPDVDLCVGDPFYIVNGVVPTNYDTLTWTSSGSGTFAPNNTVIAPTYFPSASDYTLGTVTLTLTASRNPLNCNSSSSNTITLHFISPPTADAGPANATICEGSSYVTIGTSATNYSNVTWSTTGTGTFTNATTLLATYTPSAADYNLGFVDLTLMANPLTPCTAPITDVIRLFLQKLPVITLTPTDAICVTQNSYGIGGTTVTDYAPNSYVWTTSGTGTFSPSGDPLNPIYNPSNADLAAGSVTLTLTVNSIAPCAIPVSSTLVLSFQKLPVANAGADLTRCALPFQIQTATADLTTVSNLVWSTSGTGTFDFTNIIDPNYTPSAADILNGTVRLTLTANPIAPCAVPLVTYFDVTLIKEPLITVVTPQPTICADETNVLVNGTVVQNAVSYIWTSSTGTTISNATSLTPIVTPSALDIINGYIDITITAIPNAPCSTNETLTVRIPVQKKPSVASGASQTICEGTVITTSDALSSNVTNLHWDNNGGDGTFTTSNLNTVTEYTPGPNEIASGQVLLTLHGDAVAPCSGSISSTTVYTIVKNPIVTISPTEVTICETDTYTIPLNYITIVNPTSILSHQWTTTTMASLTGATSWTPTYTPTAADIIAGFVNLTLTITPIAPCATPIVRTFKINIAKKATIDATQSNYIFCENTPKQLTAVFSNHDAATIQWQIVSGAGTLSGANTATPIFTPDASSTTVVIEVSASSNLPCSLIATEQFTLNVIKKPIVSFANTSDTICNTQTSYPLNGNSVANAIASTTYLWTTTGTGTFANNTALVTTYNFSAADLLLNSVTLRLLATSDSVCALTDYKEITINITQAPTVVTAPIENICEDTVFTATATATNSTSVLWTTVGTSNGTFTNANQLVSQYTQGTNDITSFTLQITANGNAPCAAVTATKVVNVQKKPILDAGIENRFNCSSLPYQITGVTGQNLGTVLWTSNSVNPGTFSNPSVLNPIYTPSAAELNAGTPIILTVTAQAIAPCTGSVTDFIILNLTPNQVVDAGTYPAICEGAIVSLIGSATNASSVNWTSTGTGTFSAVNSLTTNYIPSAADIISGTVTLTLHAISDSNCPEVIDTTIITILKKPTANAGSAVSICEGSSYTLAAGEATAANYTAITWSATGPGALDATTINTLTPTYIPAAGQTGTVTLTLTATGYPACGINAVSDKTITIVPSPIVTVIPTKTICEGTTLTISATDASAINYANLQWSSSNGLGTFTPNNAAATIYTPATGQTGLVTLTLTASSTNGVCPTSTGNIVLDIIAKPIVEAGTNGTICQTGTYTVTGASVQNSTLYSWNVSGPATIQAGSETTLSPVIVPNTGASGTITVTLTAVGNGICPVSISDSLTIQINPAPVVNAGTSGYLCEGMGSFQLNGTGSNANTYSWTTTGGGIIQQTGNPLAPLYIPSASDYNTANGVSVITINLNGTSTNGCSSATDSIQLTLYAKPKINAGLDIVACEDNTSALLNNATISNYNSGYTVSWSSTGNGTWDYSNSNGGINPVYIFGSNDTSSVTLTMSVLPNANCPQVAVTDSMTITIHQNPNIITSTNAITMCGETFTLPDLVTVSNNSSIQWADTTGGTLGTLTNATTETPIFTPSANEIANGVAQLTLTALPLSGCTIPATSTITINLQPKAIVNAGTNITACQGEVVTVNNNASVQNYSTFTWTENGTGYIEPSTLNSLNPVYNPGTNESGVITFTLQATNLAPCTGTVSQTMTLTITAQPTANAGPDATICQNSNYTLGAASATNYTSIIWSSSPNPTGIIPGNYNSGTFNNATIVNPIYTPSQDDITLGYVYLTIKALNPACNSIVSDVIKLTINSGPSVSAGSNATICEGSTFTLSGTSQANTTPSIIWTASDNSNGISTPSHIFGTFSNNAILNPVYTPSVDDINTGHVYLTLTGNASANCPSDSSTILLTIVKKPSVSTTDVQMCMDTPQVTLVGNATNYQNLNWSIFSGPGSIIDNNSNPLQPTFVSGVSGSPTGTTTVVRLFVTPLAGCPQSTSVYSDLTITVQPLPVVNAGQDGWLCYTPGTPIGLFTINGTSVTNNGVNITNTLGVQNWTSSSAFGIFSGGNPFSYQSNSNSCNTETLTLSVNGTGACASHAPITDTVTLNLTCASPNLGPIFPATSQICEGQTITYNVQNIFSTTTNNAVQNYIWSVPTDATIVSGQGTNSVQVLFGSNSGAVSVTATNACGVSTVTLPTTVTSLPTAVATISGPQTVCAGSTGNVYTATTIPGATSYIWTLPNGTTVTTTTNSITISFGANEVSGNLTVMGSNSCGDGTVSAAYPITINPQPSLSSTLTPPAICSATAFAYTPTSTIAGSTFAWTVVPPIGITVAGPTSGNGLINQILTNTTPNVLTVVYQITTTSPLGCTNTESVSVVVNPAPSLTSNPTPGPICSGTAFNYTPTSASIGAITWIRNTTPGIVEAGTNGSGSITEVLTNSSNAPVTVTYLLTIPATANGCTNATPISLNVIVNPAGQVNTPTSPVVCNGTNQNIVLTTLSTGGTTSYTWTNTAQSIGLSNGSGVNLPSFVASNNSTAPITGTILVTPTFTNAGLSCAGNPMTFTVTVNPAAQVDQPATQVVCNGNAANINLTTSNTGGSTTYTWTNSDQSIGLNNGSGTIIPSFTAINTGTAPVNATIVVTPSYTNGGVTCTGTAKTFTITVNPSAQVNQPAPVVYCNGNSATINFTSLTTGGTANYSWTNTDTSIGLAATGSGVSQSFIAVNTGSTPVVASIVVTPSFTNAGVACSGPTKSYTITVNPSADVNQPTSQVLCNGSTTTAIAFTSNNTLGTTTYSWTNNNPSIGLIASGNSDNIPSFTAINAGTSPAVATIIVTPTYTYNGVTCSGSPKTFTITVNPNGQVNQTTPQVFCNGSQATVSLSTLNTGGITNYSWTTTNSGIGLANGTGANLPSFVANNTGLVPESATIVVTPTFTYGGESCAGTPQTFTITVNPSAQVNPIASQVVCNGTATTAIAFTTNNNLGTTTYSWTNNNPNIGLAAVGGSNTIPSFNAINLGTTPQVATITVTPTYTNAGISCNQNQMTFTITVNPSAQVNQLATQVFCNGSNASINLTTQNIGGTTTYTWINSDENIGLINGTGTSIPSFIAINNSSIPKVATVTVTPTFTNAGVTCTGTAMTFTVVINPNAQVNQPNNQVFCNGNQATINLTTTTAGGATTYAWTNTDSSIGLAASGSSNNLPTFIASNTGTSPVVATVVVTPTFTNAGGSCTSAPITFTVTVNPEATIDAVASQVLCNGTTSTSINFTTPNTVGTTTYSWTNSDPSIGLSASGTGNTIPTFIATNLGNTPKVATITVTPTYTNAGVNCVGTPITFTITVNPSAQINQPTAQVFCNGNPAIVNLSSINTGGINSYTWTNTDPSIGIAASSTGVIPPFIATNLGSSPITSLITVTPTFTNAGVTCTSAPTSFTITVNPSAQINSIASQVLCKGATSSIINFTSTNFGGTTTYAWTNSNPNIGLFPTSGTGDYILPFTATNNGTTPLVSTITVTPTYTNAGLSCTGAPISFTITVNPVPQVNQPNPQVFCNGSNAFVNFTTLNTAGATSYSWTNSNTTIGLAPNGIGNILPFTAINTGTVPQVATIIVTPTFTNAGLSCDGDPMMFTITVNPSAQVNQLVPQIFCNGTSASINLNSLNTGGITTYAWTNSEPSIGLPANGSSNNLPTFTATNTGTLPVVADLIITPTYSNAGVTCTGAPMTFTVTVNPSAQVDQPNPQVFCNGSTTSLINFTTQNIGGVTTYDWIINNSNIGLTPTSGSGAIPSFIATNIGTTPVVATVTVTPNFTNDGVTCTGSPKTFTITINPSAQVDQPAPQVFCNGNNANINLTTINTGGITTYAWTNSDPSIGLAGSGNGIIPSFVANNTGTTPVVANIVITPIYTNLGESCLGTPKTFTVTINPSAQVDQPTSQVLCNGSASTVVLFTSNNTNGTTTYSWINDNPSIGLLASGTSNNIPSFIATNVTNAPQVANITIAPVYTFDGVSCTGPTKTFTITVNPSPQVDQMNPQIFCNGSATNMISFTTSNTGGTTTFDWQNSNPNIGLASAGIGFIPSFTPINNGTIPISSTITVTPTYTYAGVSCTGSPMTFTITINPSAQVNPIASIVKCNGETVTLNLSTVNSVGTTTYSWTNSAPSIGLINNSGNNIPSFIAINNGTTPVVANIIVTPTYTNNGVICTGAPMTFTITVNPTAQVDQPANQVFCNGTNTSLINFSTANTLGTTTYTWTNNNPSIGLLGNGTGPIPTFQAINMGTIPLVATITVTPSYSYAGITCTGAPKTFTITINPAAELDQPADQVFCNGTMATINLTTPTTVGTTSYSWTNSAPSIGLPSGTGSNIPTFMASNPGSFPVVGTIVVTPTYTYAGLSCNGNSKTFTVTVNPSPQVNTVNDQVICNLNPTTIINFTTSNTGE
jgi:hypothetical protein